MKCQNHEIDFISNSMCCCCSWCTYVTKLYLAVNIKMNIKPIRTFFTNRPKLNFYKKFIEFLNDK